MSKEKRIYSYSGPVMRFEKCVENNWIASTLAVSERQAINNLKHRYRMKENLSRNSDISLPGKITAIT
jgi:hypothetical protein